MSPDLPPALRAAIERELAGVSRRGLAGRAQAISLAYRDGQPSSRAVTAPADAQAYALARLPATYAAAAAVFAEARARAPDFAPASLTDAGAGPGGASWAALEAWPGIGAVTLLDNSAPFRALAGRLAADGPPPLRDAAIAPADLSSVHRLPTADLVVASYLLAEIAPDRQAALVDALWAACSGILAIVEPGTPAGFIRILAAREQVVREQARLLAPCSHDGACPLASPDWCHFAQRLPRSRDHRLAKGAEAPFEDEKFIYFIASRPHVAASAATRVLAPPRAGKPGIELKLCTPAGLERRFVPRRDKPAHAAVRRLGWGDALPD
jgi:ribosomal protein RSM22 (predicted rRNA methylase)